LKPVLVLLSTPMSTDRSRAEKLWLVYGVMGDVTPCDRERERYTP
jgi:hypothetical protein